MSNGAPKDVSNRDTFIIPLRDPKRPIAAKARLPMHINDSLWPNIGNDRLGLNQQLDVGIP